MANNLSTIGFAFSDDDGFRAAMLGCAGKIRDTTPCSGGAYGIWKSGNGAEIWFHLGRADDGETEILGLTPYFEGESLVKLRITNAISDAADNAYEGALQGWVVADGEAEGSYPVVFHAVDFAVHRDSAWPEIRNVRLTGFARELQAFASDAAYYAARGAPDAESLKLAAHAFIPLGLFNAANDNALAPTGSASTAVLTGTVLAHRDLTNEETGGRFIWLLVQSLEAAFDVVADPAVISGEIVDGGVIEASVMLFGRIVDGTPAWPG